MTKEQIEDAARQYILTARTAETANGEAELLEAFILIGFRAGAEWALCEKQLKELASLLKAQGLHE